MKAKTKQNNSKTTTTTTTTTTTMFLCLPGLIWVFSLIVNGLLSPHESALLDRVVVAKLVLTLWVSLN